VRSGPLWGQRAQCGFGRLLENADTDEDESIYESQRKIRKSQESVDTGGRLMTID
jgi:hypothetical protein